ncbi:MAG: hypothetical protein PXZ07_10985 [Candidatus Eremiobacteraeota bacterium]|nr:hypothetical protein [Candidatus Eremiobacteraeota bacterium]
MAAAIFAPLLLALIGASTTTQSAQMAVPGWTALPLQAGDYRRYERTNQQGFTSTLAASDQVCTCQPKEFSKELSTALSKVAGSTVKTSPTKICDESGEYLIATGLAGTEGRRNLEVYSFRKRGTFYVLEDTFNSPAPTLAAHELLTSLCP